MMNWAAFILFMILALPVSTFAASDKAASPKLGLSNEENAPVSNKVINDYYESCLYHIPDRFTPDARKYYCACNAAAMQGNFRTDDFNRLQNAAIRKPGNKLFEKYVHTAVAPCLTDLPVKQIEYLACLLDSSNDVRIGYAPGYCSCVSQKMVAHAKALSEAEIMAKLSEDPSLFKEPVDALWNNEVYLRTKYKSRDDCIIEGH